MTHNVFKVGNISPDTNGALSLTSSDLSDLGTFADGDLLIYNATSQQWVGGTDPSGGANSATFGRGEEDDYLNCGFSFSVGSTIGIYDTAPRNNISAYVTFNKVAGTNWLETISLEEGLYTLYASVGVVFSASGMISYRFRDLDGNILSSCGALPETSLFQGSTSYSMGWVNVSSAEAPLTIRLRVQASSNVSPSAQGTFLSKRSMISIQRMQ